MSEARTTGVSQLILRHLFAARESGSGTFATCRLHRAMFRVWGLSGKHMLALSSSQIDPTRTTGDVGFRAAVRGIADIKRALIRGPDL